jgi:hypothetical protein
MGALHFEWNSITATAAQIECALVVEFSIFASRCDKLSNALKQAALPPRALEFLISSQLPPSNSYQLLINKSRPDLNLKKCILKIALPRRVLISIIGNCARSWCAVKSIRDRLFTAVGVKNAFAATTALAAA